MNTDGKPRAKGANTIALRHLYTSTLCFDANLLAKTSCDFSVHSWKFHRTTITMCTDNEDHPNMQKSWERFFTHSPWKRSQVPPCQMPSKPCSHTNLIFYSSRCVHVKPPKKILKIKNGDHLLQEFDFKFHFSRTLCGTVKSLKHVPVKNLPRKM